MALAAALGILMVLGLLMAGAVAASVRAHRSARLADGEIALAASADDAVYGVLEDGNGAELADLPLGLAATSDISDPAAHGISARVAVTRLPANLLWIVADAVTVPSRDAERRVSIVAEFRVAGRPPPAGIVSRGNVTLGSGVVVTSDPGGDADCAVTAAPDVVIAPGAHASMEGELQVEPEGAASDSSTYLLTDRQIEMLRGRPGVTYVSGDTTLAGGVIEGILIVAGTATISGPVAVTGLMVTVGAVRAGNGSLNVTGGLMAFAPPLGVGDSAVDGIVLNEGTIQYAPCVIARALRRAAQRKPLRNRGWSELF
jgi:hypothetical protein